MANDRSSLANRVKALNAKITKAGSLYSHTKEQVEEEQAQLEEATTRQENAMLAKQLVIAVAEKTQVNIGKRISDLVSLALASIWDNPYEFQVEFVPRRGVTEADLWFCRDGNKIEPLSASGGGTVDIASFALRLAVWSLSKSHNTFILDEPFRNLSPNNHAAAGQLLQELSRKLGAQIIMVSHSQDITSGADRVFRVQQNGTIVEE